MDSIRPLVTITILVVVGAFLYVKINQGPARPVPSVSDAWPHQPPEGVPPLAGVGAASESDGGAAPSWPTLDTPAPSAAPVETAVATTPQTLPSPNEAPAAAVASGPAATPTVPAIPDLLDVAGPPPSAAPPTAAVDLPTDLPANIPTARYPDQPIAAAPPTATNPPPSAPPSANVAESAPGELAPPPLAAAETSPAQPAAPAAEPDRYAASAYTGAPPAAAVASAPAQASFAAAWPAIEAALQRGELANAHQLLSRWYGDPSLTPTDAERVELLLSQLAGTVVYSTEHHLEPPHIVKPGETLETIAEDYKVPWQLLAKINGIPASDAVQPGQELKVVRGPFSAVADLDRKELVLMLADRYAGRFAVSPPVGVSVPDGEWIVQKTTERHLILTNRPGADASIGDPLIIGSDPKSIGLEIQRAGEDGQIINVAVAELTVSAHDAEEMADILSVGSRVVIRH